MSDTPKSCPFCGSYVALLDDGTHCGDSEGNWTAFGCLTSWHRGYPDLRKLQSKTCETVERQKLHERIKRMKEAGDAMMSEPCEYTFEQWIKSKEERL